MVNEAFLGKWRQLSNVPTICAALMSCFRRARRNLEEDVHEVCLSVKMLSLPISPRYLESLTDLSSKCPHCQISQNHDENRISITASYGFQVKSPVFNLLFSSFPIVKCMDQLWFVDTVYGKTYRSLPQSYFAFNKYQNHYIYNLESWWGCFSEILFSEAQTDYQSRSLNVFQLRNRFCSTLGLQQLRE